MIDRPVVSFESPAWVHAAGLGARNLDSTGYALAILVDVSDEDLRQIKDRVFSALAKGKLEQALEYLEELEASEPEDGAWPGKIGETERRLGRNVAAISALSRAVDKYFAAGFLAKAIATGKMILRIEAEHSIPRKSVAVLVVGGGEHELETKLPMEAMDIGKAGPEDAVIEAGSDGPPGSPSEAPGHAGPGMDSQSSLESISLAEVMGLGDGRGEGEISIEIEEPETSGETRLEETLVETRLFKELSAESIGRLIQEASLVELEPRQILFRQGDAADSLFVIAEGALEVVTGETPHRRLSLLREGEFFGEIGLIAGQPRNATVRALETTVLLELSRAVVSELMAEEPAVLKVLLHFLRGRLVDTLVKTHPLFQSFEGAEKRHLASRFRLLELQENTEIISQGSPAAGLYVLLSGAAEVVREIAGVPTRLAVLGTGDLAGEMSQLTQEGAVATVRITRRAFAFQLPASAFQELIMTHPQVLEYVGELAEKRRLEMRAIEIGQENTREARLSFL